MKRLAMLVLAACALASGAARGQIYECVGEDGGRVFSDERCGPDAKIVKGITSRKRSSKDAAAARPKRAPKSAPELEALSAQCDAGDMKACREWTLGGGPNLLRQNERAAELECEAGSLAACEKRYCAEGMNAECRERVLRTAPLAGENWYLREEDRGGRDGLTRYHIRCAPEEGGSRDVTIACASQTGPNRCSVENSDHGYARLDRAAAAECRQDKE